MQFRRFNRREFDACWQRGGGVVAALGERAADRSHVADWCARS